MFNATKHEIHLRLVRRLLTIGLEICCQFQ